MVNSPEHKTFREHNIFVLVGVGYRAVSKFVKFCDQNSMVPFQPLLSFTSKTFVGLWGVARGIDETKKAEC